MLSDNENELSTAELIFFQHHTTISYICTPATSDCKWKPLIFQEPGSIHYSRVKIYIKKKFNFPCAHSECA